MSESRKTLPKSAVYGLGHTNPIRRIATYYGLDIEYAMMLAWRYRMVEFEGKRDRLELPLSKFAYWKISGFVRDQFLASVHVYYERLYFNVDS